MNVQEMNLWEVEDRLYYELATGSHHGDEFKTRRIGYRSVTNEKDYVGFTADDLRSIWAAYYRQRDSMNPSLAMVRLAEHILTPSDVLHDILVTALKAPPWGQPNVLPGIMNGHPNLTNEDRFLIQQTLIISASLA